MMEVKPLLSFPKGFEVIDIERTDDLLTIHTVSTQVHAACPLCGIFASRIHSRYTRLVTDMPCGGLNVRLILQVRKFFCEATSCTRKIFAERLAPFVEPCARVTARLFQIVQVIGLTTGGMLGAR